MARGANGAETWPAVQFLVSRVRAFGLGLVLINVFVARAGIPVPAYPTLIVAGAFLATGPGAAGGPLPLAVPGAVFADTLWYLGGRRYGMRVQRTLCRVSLSPDACVAQTETTFARCGAASMLFAKFIPGFASVATAMAGAVGLRFWKFLVFDVIGALLWAGVGVGWGWLFRDAIAEVLDALATSGCYGVVLVALALAAYIGARWVRRQQFVRQLRMDRVSVDELRAMLASEAPTLILDVRSAVTKAASGRVPGARLVDVKRIGDGVDGVSTEHEVVVYCACPNEASAVKVAGRLRALGFKRVRPLHGGIEAWIEAGLDVEF